MLSDDTKGQTTGHVDEPDLSASTEGGGEYEIRIKGHLSPKWSDWLAGMDVVPLASGDTVLQGFVVDQAALVGILNTLHRLNLTLLGVRKVNKT